MAQHSEEKLDKHRFLVQSRVIEDSDYNRILGLPASQRSDEVSDVMTCTVDIVFCHVVSLS